MVSIHELATSLQPGGGSLARRLQHPLLQSIGTAHPGELMSRIGEAKIQTSAEGYGL